ncbi:hypothetical protein OURE66S_02251 [Oligella ureolytica]
MWIWFAIAAIALILELLSGTFVLLLICLGAVAAGAAAWFELGIIIQLALLAIIPVIGIFVLKRIGKFHLRNPLASEADSNLNLDIGKSVYVDDWDWNDVVRSLSSEERSGKPSLLKITTNSVQASI